MGYKNRDVEVVRIDQGLCLVTACDSCGGIGNKKMDLLKVPFRLVGQMTARLVLLEILSTGAVPRVITVAVSSEADPTGNELIQGVRMALEDAGFKDLAMAVSTEKNFLPAQTGIGIGITGTCYEKKLKIGLSHPGDDMYCMGLPLVGKEVTEAAPSQIISTRHVRQLLSCPGIGDIVPVGSRGIRSESRDLARFSNARFIPEKNTLVDIDKSAGPSTCAIFTCRAGRHPELDRDLPLSRIGRLAPISETI